MYKRILSLIFIFSCFNFVSYANNRTKPNQQNGTEIKDAVAKIGENGRVKMVDGYRIDGSQVVAVDKTNSAIEIQYSQVKEFKADRNVPAGIISGVTVGVVGGGVVAVIALLFSRFGN
jgi:hypothetical protein